MRHLTTALIAALLAGGGGAAALAATPDPEMARQATIMTQVKLLVLQHKPAEAIPLAEQVIAAGEARAAAEKRQVYSGQTIEMVMANMLVAAGSGQSAVDIGPSYGEALFFKGFALIDAGRAEEAGAFLDRAVAVSPNNAQFLCEDGSWYNQHHKPDRALTLYKQCEAENGLMSEAARPHTLAVAKRGQGFSLIDLGRLEEAQARYEESLKLEPNDTHAQNDLTYIRWQREKAARATT